jgi:hypothetical protein
MTIIDDVIEPGEVKVPVPFRILYPMIFTPLFPPMV